jgi:superfamily II DNA or RNA helicase
MSASPAAPAPPRPRPRSRTKALIEAHAAEALLVPGDPARAARVALWHPDGVPEPPPGDAERWPSSIEPLVLVTATGKSVRTRTISARLVPVPAILPFLVGFTPSDSTTATLAAWVIAARLGNDLVARGRLYPGITDSGLDTWRAGPLDTTDDERLAALAERFPALAHATPVAGVKPLALPDAATAIRTFWDAIADTLVRTAAAPRVTASPAYAAPLADAAPVDLSALANWVALTGHGLNSQHDGARPVLRLDLPDADDRPIHATLQLRSQTDPSLVVDSADLWDAPDAVLARLGDEAESDLLLALHRGSKVWAPLRRALAESRPTDFDIDDAEAADLMGPAADDLAAAGFEVLWPKALTTQAVSLRAVVSTPSPGAVAASGLDLNAIVTFRWEASLGGEPLTAAELHTLAEAKRPLVRLRGNWVAADPTLLARMRRGPGRIRTSDALGAALAGTIRDGEEEIPVEIEGALATLAARLRALSGADAGTDSGAGSGWGEPERELPEPAGLEASLRPYQRRGLAWLAEMTALGLGGCLADDMGLGKTIQLIALHLHQHESSPTGRTPRSTKPTLVVCPTSLLGNWERELRRFAPTIPVRRYHGGERHLEKVAEDEVVLVTYGVVRRDRVALAEIEWGLVVADEAQHVKNPLARTARELRLIPAEARLALTGTPVENRLSELWAILDWTTPGLLGPLETFRRNVAVPIERHKDPETTERLARLVRPFLLRRRKIDPGIAPELPAKTETDQFVPLTTEQATLYEAVVRETMDQIENAEGIARRGLVLKLLTALKQITNHPAQYLKQPGPLDGRSGKLAALDELLDTILDAGDSVLIFTQYVGMGRLLEQHLRARNISPLFLHGGVPVAAREKLVDRFQAGEERVFLLSLKAGGTGLNLTRATHVVHYDRWWNPAVEDQATDRAFRIGQDRPVQVHRLISEGTVEDRIAQLLMRKRDLADAVVGTGEGWIGELSNEELSDLVALARDGDAFG